MANTLHFNKRNIVKASLVLAGLLMVLRLFGKSESGSDLMQDKIVVKQKHHIEFDKNLFIKHNDEKPKKSALKIESASDIRDKLLAGDFKKSDVKSEDAKSDKKYIMDVNAERLNRLFDILIKKEQTYGPILDDLNVVSFSKLVKKENDKALKPFQTEADQFLKVENDKVVATDKFVQMLNQKSESHSFTNPRNNVAKARVEKDKPVIITAANSAYYSPLQATVSGVHTYFPDYHLIVYDLGLEPSQAEMTRENCKCEVIRFDLSGNYSKISPHITDLKTYAWKPLLIQETLRKHDSVIYIDSSIRFYNNELLPVINTLREVGLLTQYINLKLTCYTNPLQFEWFGEKAQSYSDFYTIEANILFFHRNFISSLMMKAWVTCALDKDCIAPVGSSIGGCCGCHRFDQDAITIVSSFFYGHPHGEKYLPAYSFTKAESYFFHVRRYEGMSYFTPKPSKLETKSLNQTQS